MKPPENHYTAPNHAPNIMTVFLLDFSYYYCLSYIVISHVKTCVNASWPLEFSKLSWGTQPETSSFFILFYLFIFCTPTFKLIPAPLVLLMFYARYTIFDVVQISPFWLWSAKPRFLDDSKLAYLCWLCCGVGYVEIQGGGGCTDSKSQLLNMFNIYNPISCSVGATPRTAV